MIYFILLFVLLLFGGFVKASKWLYYFCVTALIVLLGGRGDHIGADTTRYLDYYNAPGAFYMEPGWNMLKQFGHFVGLNAAQFQFLIAIVSVLLVAYVVGKVFPRRKDRFISMAFFLGLGYYFLMFNGMRQMLAVTICFVAYYLISKDKMVLGVVAIGIASLIHISALITIPILLVSTLPSPRIQVLFILQVVSIIIGLILDIDLLARFSGGYADTLLKYGVRNDPVYFSLYIIPYNFLFLFVAYTGQLNRRDLWFKLFFIFILYQNVTMNFPIAPRIGWYPGIAELIVYTQYIQHALSKHRRLNATIVTVFCMAMFVRWLLGQQSGENPVFPYAFSNSLFL